MRKSKMGMGGWFATMSVVILISGGQVASARPPVCCNPTTGACTVGGGGLPDNCPSNCPPGELCNGDHNFCGGWVGFCKLPNRECVFVGEDCWDVLNCTSECGPIQADEPVSEDEEECTEGDDNSVDTDAPQETDATPRTLPLDALVAILAPLLKAGL